MRCLRCSSENEKASRTCSSCGAPLRAMLPRRKQKATLIVVMGGALILAGIAYLFFRTASSDLHKKDGVEISPAVETSPRPKMIEGQSVIPVIGTVIIQGRSGEELAELECAVVNGNWIAAPVCAFLIGENWMFRAAQKEETPIVEGIWESGNPVALWRYGKEKPLKSAELTGWNRKDPLAWKSLNGMHSVDQIEILSPRQEGHFTSISLPQILKDQGILMQNGNVVGWTFGMWLERGFLWDEPDNFGFDRTISAEEFSSTISLHWQEKLFSTGLATRNDATARQRLKLLAEGFLLPPQFPPENKPLHLRSEAVALQLHSLASQLLQTGSLKEVMDSLDERVLQEAESIDLLKDATLARVKIQDHWKAIQFFERTEKNLERTKGAPMGLDDFHSWLYKDWITNSIDNGEHHSGRMAFELGKRLFPDDIDLHILGIRQALSEKEWAVAKELLEMRSYPEHFQDQVKHLEQLITEKLEPDRTVHILFEPGAKQIFVEGAINRSVRQYFQLDTGASLVSIPFSTAEKLNIKITEDTPLKPVLTVSDVGLAYEVTLESIEIGGAKVENIQALIIDLPGLPGVGLLGTEFLRHFNIEIDNQNGILKLKPR